MEHSDTSMGFAGPGEYEGGEPGSPINALKAVRRHRYYADFAEAGKTIEFVFVDKDPEYCRHLRGKIGATSWPRAFRIEAKLGEFEEILTALLDDVVAEAAGDAANPTLH